MLALLAQAAEQQSPMGSFQGMFVMISLFFVIFYFLVMRPQSKQQNELKTMRDKLAKGDEVVTAGGVVGRISKLGEQYLTLEIAPNTEIVVQRSAVSVPLPKGTLKTLQ